MTISHWQRSHPFAMPNTQADIVIVGAGYLGLSTAWWLTEHNPGLRIAVIDRSRPGAGASGRNAGFLTKGSAYFYKGLINKWGVDRASSVLEFAEKSLELVDRHILKSSPEIKAEKVNSVTLTRNRQELKELTQAFGFNWNEEIPERLKGSYEGAFESGSEYKVNPMELIATLKKSLEARKVQIIDSAGAFKITEDGVQTVLNRIKAGKVILALNGYAPEFHASFGEIITPNRAQMLAVEVDENFLAPDLYYDPAQRVYWRKLGEKSLLIGGKRLVDPANEKSNFEKVSPQIQDALEDYVKNTLGLQYKVLHRWSGIMGFTEHELPVISKVLAPVSTWFVGGFSGHGMGLGFHAAKELSEIVIGEKDQSFFSSFKKIEIKL